MANPLYVYLVSRLSDQGSVITSIQVDEDDWDHLKHSPAFKDSLMQDLRRIRDETRKAAGKTDVTVPGLDEWFYGDDASDAFIRNRELRKLDW